MNIIIQQPKIEDIPEIQDVVYFSWLDTYPNKELGITKEDVEEQFKDRKSSESIAKATEKLANMPENQLFLVAKEKDKIVGICRTVKHPDYDELKIIYILPEYQRNGIGRMFWEKAKIFFGTDKNIIVRVANYNQKAISFYRKLGFVDTGKCFMEEKFKMPISGKIIPQTEMIFHFEKQ
jgi:ribosomal protein S18 acetylase RimI-like enzyme